MEGANRPKKSPFQPVAPRNHSNLNSTQRVHGLGRVASSHNHRTGPAQITRKRTRGPLPPHGLSAGASHRISSTMRPPFLGTSISVSPFYNGTLPQPQPQPQPPSPPPAAPAQPVATGLRSKQVGDASATVGPTRNPQPAFPLALAPSSRNQPLSARRVLEHVTTAQHRDAAKINDMIDALHKLISPENVSKLSAIAVSAIHKLIFIESSNMHNAEQKASIMRNVHDFDQKHLRAIRHPEVPRSAPVPAPAAASSASLPQLTGTKRRQMDPDIIHGVLENEDVARANPREVDKQPRTHGIRNHAPDLHQHQLHASAKRLVSMSNPRNAPRGASPERGVLPMRRVRVGKKVCRLAKERHCEQDVMGKRIHNRMVHAEKVGESLASNPPQLDESNYVVYSPLPGTNAPNGILQKLTANRLEYMLKQDGDSNRKLHDKQEQILRVLWTNLVVDNFTGTVLCGAVGMLRIHQVLTFLLMYFAWNEPRRKQLTLAIKNTNCSSTRYFH